MGIIKGTAPFSSRHRSHGTREYADFKRKEI